MSNDAVMYSDDDTPLANNPTTNRPSKNSIAKHKRTTKDANESSMSEEEDVPLVRTACSSFISDSIFVPQSQTRVVKSTPRGQKRKKSIKSEASSSDDDAPLASNSTKGKDTVTKQRTKKPLRKKARDSEDEDDKPLVQKRPPSRKRKAPSTSVDETSSDDDEPIARIAAKTRATKVKKEQDSDQPLKVVKQETAGRGKKASAVKKEETGNSRGKVKVKKEKDADKDEEQEEVFRWWEGDVNGDGSAKWSTLEHNGVFFPPPYEPLPSNIKLKYNGTAHVLLLYPCVA